jgi:hypothetical protein
MIAESFGCRESGVVSTVAQEYKGKDSKIVCISIGS